MHDVVIAGAGPVGTLLQAELARLGVEATVIERRAQPGPGSRAVGVHPAALDALEASGATARILSSAIRVVRGEARAARPFGVVRFDRLEARHPYVATLPQSRTEDALAEAAASWGATAVVRGCTVEGVRGGPEAVRLRLRRGDVTTEETARIVVVATGSAGRAITPLTASTRIRAYPDRYVMTDAPDATGEGTTAVVHLHPEGVLESFPLPGGMRRFVAWRSPADAEAEPTGWLRDAITRRTGSADAASAVSTAAAFGVRRALVPRMRWGRVVAIGDAAHEVSPIGGQGMNLGLIDAATLAPLLASWIVTGEEPAGELREWDRRRRRAAAMSARIATANTVIGRTAGPVAHRARTAALRGILHSPAANMLARAYSMGLDPG
ncbi:NAD(P)/FAD-dependent oxidoreductase [Microbacterium limosum]|uniref:NAD(P)/FAD-dependent oxidoreductase n=1 Tax=Microbacterium limosum TaxID=3079935 RepID=A0AAU0MHA5_9MICO|nr:NAD(P)/FAD-dependent oxidoreductase [Microbacterium sp. Y20]WOQ69535.1 NAD(P)/FAD-dependent oxidoreductase [Microbacterium sp. Y20]